MKKILMVLFILFVFISPISVFADKQNDEEETNSRYVVVEIPIYAECQGGTHRKMYGLVQLNGSIVSNSGRIVWRGDTPIYTYIYYDQYANYYEPYFDGYTSTGFGSYESGCPIW